jgi:hypothetical protein
LKPIIPKSKENNECQKREVGEDFSTKYTLEIEKGEGEDKCGLGVNGAKNHLFPLQKASEKERTCTFNQPL